MLPLRFQKGSLKARLVWPGRSSASGAHPPPAGVHEAALSEAKTVIEVLTSRMWSACPGSCNGEQSQPEGAVPWTAVISKAFLELTARGPV